MKQKTQLILSGAILATSGIVLGGLNVHAVDTVTVQVNDINGLQTCLEEAANNTCVLESDLTPTANLAIGAPAGQTKILDLNGHTINGEYTIETNSISIVSLGDFVVKDSGTDGAMYGPISAKGNLSIAAGTFYGSISLYGESNQISGGTFNGTVFPVMEDDITTKISGGTFNKMVNAAVYHAGSSLKIQGGIFNKGFYISVENLAITDGVFKNGLTRSDGWLVLGLNSSNDQTYSITGGEFINTEDENGILMAIFTSVAPTEEMISAIFEGGDVLEGLAIQLDEDSTAAPWVSYIVKELESEVTAPDTGVNTMLRDSMNATSIITLVASALAGSFALGVILYFGLHKKVAFSKK